ncbi:glucose-1-phosphate adenylyltransferase family protein [Ketogulonicigenium vulgare]|uniref:glucose-1-phosphate adenylyltransferase family protein n=1 Tax=Ketogulonicigenium vulgare TaxID=92945 RepID=UPI002358B448|nr:sugar phosphate nucleotidyltransferase [Ketogulonicigenium vulgare]
MFIHFEEPTKTFCILLAGGKGARLHELTENVCKPALPFAGGHLIDFTLENAVRSGVRQVLVAGQYRANSLSDYLQRAWAGRFDQGLVFRNGFQFAPGGYAGTADAVRANFEAVLNSGADTVLVLSADHVYRMDYRQMIEAHRASGAKVTVAADLVDIDKASSFGVLDVNADGRIRHFLEKPNDPPALCADPTRALVSMGIYVFDRAWLAQALSCDDRHDFGHEILPIAVDEGVAHAYRPAAYDGGTFYWRDVGTLDSYLQAQLDFIAGTSRPFSVGHMECFSPAVRRAAMTGSVLLPGASVEEGAMLSRAIVAAGVRVPSQLRVGFDRDEDLHWFRTTANGTALITAGMIANWQAAHSSGKPLEYGANVVGV